MEHLEFLITHLKAAITIGLEAPLTISRSDLAQLSEIMARLEKKLAKAEAWLDQPIKVRDLRAKA